TEYGTVAALARVVPEATLVDGARPLELLRAHKDEEELSHMRQAIRLTHRAFDAAFGKLVPGMRDQDVEGFIGLEFERAGVRGYAVVQFGARSALPHGAARGDVLTRGDVREGRARSELDDRVAP